MQSFLAFLSRILDGIKTFLETSLTNLPASSDFWSGIIGAVVGAVVGGLISYLVQLRALNETRDQRREDRLLVQQALANALLFKVIRIYSDFHGIDRHIEECFERAKKDDLEGEPWQFVLPLANFPEAIHFSADEMGLVLGLKDDNVFNKIVDLDLIHNSLIDAEKLYSSERRALAARLEADEVKGNMLSGNLSKEAYFALKPQMIEVNGLIKDIKSSAKRDTAESFLAMKSLHKLLKERLGLTYNIESKFILE